MKHNIYHACDIRGIADRDLDDATVADIARALGVMLTGKTVVVGGDIRLSTPRLKPILCRELAASGCRVLDIGTVATPVFYYALRQSEAEGGVMITASHNPAPYNGFKLVLGPLPVREEEVAHIASLVGEKACVRAEGSLESWDVADAYLQDTAAKAAPGKLKVVVDAGCGATAPFAPALYSSLGYEVVDLYCEADGNFPGRAPNPALAENLVALGQAVRQHQAALGVAFDGDGDRVGFVDETGAAIDNDLIMVLLARHYLEQKGPGAIIYDAKCSMVVPEAVAQAGGRAVMARAGHTFSKQAFLEEQALFAGEISGHFFLSELGYDDGMFAGLKVCEFVASHGALSSLVSEIPRYPLTPDIRVPYTGADKDALLDEAAAKLAAYQPNRIDGVRLEFADGWGMIRASVTEPLFTLRFEAKSPQRLAEIAEILVQALRSDVGTAVREKIVAAGVSL